MKGREKRGKRKERIRGKGVMGGFKEGRGKGSENILRSKTLQSSHGHILAVEIQDVEREVQR